MNIGFCVFASHTKEKYKKQIEKINETWYKDLNDKCKLFYFLNKTPHTFENKKNVTYINLNIEEDDYFSVMSKLNLPSIYLPKSHKISGNVSSICLYSHDCSDIKPKFIKDIKRQKKKLNDYTIFIDKGNKLGL